MSEKNQTNLTMLKPLHHLFSNLLPLQPCVFVLFFRKVSYSVLHNGQYCRRDKLGQKPPSSTSANQRGEIAAHGETPLKAGKVKYCTAE